MYRKGCELDVSFPLDGETTIVEFWSHGCGWSWRVKSGPGKNDSSHGGYNLCIEDAILRAKIDITFSYYQSKYSYQKSFEYADKVMDKYGRYRFSLAN